VATSTPGNPLDPHRLFAAKLRLFLPPRYPKQPKFRVFPTEEAEYHWRIVALPTSRIMSRHKSLTYALKKCIRLNQQRGEGGTNETN
jgi:hypothetical protein